MTVRRPRPRRALFLLAAFLLSAPAARPGEKLPAETYRASTIPAGLTANAHAVVRYELQEFRVTGPHSAVLEARRVVTVLDAEGRSFGEAVLYYDKFRRIGRVEGALYDAGGEKIRSLEEEDLKDYSATEGISLYDDNRVRIASIVHAGYPYTVEFAYAYEYDGDLGWPAWYPQEEDASVERSLFVVDVPKGETFRMRSNLPSPPLVQEEGGRTRYRWEAAALTPFKKEPLGPDVIDQYLSVRLAPNAFEMDKHPGDLSSWRSFGKWFYDLQAGRQVLPPGVQKEVEEIAAGAADRIGVVRGLYRYLQSKTRYVSVQLGIGGWQPFDASFVSERGYGDCKALTNYMLSLLAHAKFAAYPVLINNGTPARELIPDFPVNMFNHVILCVPLGADTAWLECTSQSTPFGHIGAGNEDRSALLVTPEGGVIVRTPRSRPEDNMLLRRASVELLPTGSASATVRSSYTGDQQDGVRFAITEASPQAREDWLRENIDIPTYTLTSTDFSPRADAPEDAVSFALALGLPRYATAAGTRLIFQPNLLDRRDYVPPALKERTHPVRLSYPYLDLDTVAYSLPAGFAAEAIPKPVTIETEFARYSASVTMLSPSSMLYVRRLELRASHLPAEAYAGLRKFYQDVAQADKANVSLVRK